MQLLTAATFIFYVALSEVMFINVFTTNLYPEEEDPTSQRLLHGVQEGQSLSEEDVQIILFHSAFYTAWLVSQFFLSIHLAKPALAQSGSTRRAAWIICLLICWAGMLLHASGMMMTIMNGKPSHRVSDFKGSQLFLAQAALVTHAHKWGWVGLFVFRFVVPSGKGVRFDVSAQSLYHKD